MEFIAQEIKSPAFQFYAQDFLTGCIYLTNEEIGMYTKMLCKQWTDGLIPKKRLGFLLGYEWVSLSDELKAKFIDCGDYVLNKRLEKEREKSINFREKQSENGKMGGRPKKPVEPETFDSIEVLENKKPKLNPNESQKKPIEVEDEDRSKKIEKENRKQKKVLPIEILEMPEDFKHIWHEWLNYRKAKKKSPYAALKYEQIAVNKFLELSNFNLETAKSILRQTIEGNWEGLYELKTDKNGTTTNTTGFKTVSPAFAERLAKGLQSQ